MPEKDPSTYSIITYTWVLGLSCWGGAVSFFHKCKAGSTQHFKITEFLGELTASAFTGIVTFYLCELAELPNLMSAVLVSISGHMGTKALSRIEAYLEKKTEFLQKINEEK